MELNIEHRPAAHCENGTISSLLRFHGILLSEPMIFGLASGLYFTHVPWMKMGGLPVTSFRTFPGILFKRITKLLCEASENAPAEFKALAEEWIANKEDADKTKEIAPKLREAIAAGAEAGCEFCKELKTLDHYLVKRSQWIIGGDGASYDIGYGGLDHVIASGEDVNILVLDTEVYSNTGGQASKATPLGAIAQFAA